MDFKLPKINGYTDMHAVGNSVVYLMDCMDFMAQVGDGQFGLAVVDPPYGIGMDNQKVRVKPNRPNSYLRAGENQYKYADWDSNVPTKEYFEKLFKVSKNQIIWGANYFCEHLPSGKGWIYWDKQMGENNFSSGELAYQSIQTKTSCFSEPSMRVSGTRIHPTQKPVALYDWIFKNYAKEGDTILDTHLGSGSSRIAAHRAGLPFVGIELDHDYFKSHVKRFNQYASQLTIQF